ncbi:MAG: cell division protein ftsK, segregation ATPase FtsK/SpoIIIE, family [Candidatus Parcubacteria bacterium]|jgi:S-DNA-T family DNA segregation ATPase FtsK/SpoIIIE
MAKKKNDLGKKAHFWDELKDETVHTILALFSFLITILSLLAAFGKAGFGNYIYNFLLQLCGVGYYLIPIMFAMLGVSFLQGLKKKVEITKLIGASLFLLSGLGIIHMSYAEAGGSVGRWIAGPLVTFVDFWAALALLIVIFVVSVIMTFNLHISAQHLMFWNYFKKAEVDGEDAKTAAELEEDEEQHIDGVVAKATGMSNLERAEAMRVAEEQRKRDEANKRQTSKKSSSGGLLDDDGSFAMVAAITPHLKPFNPPPLSLLEKDKGKPETGDIKANANIIKRTLQNFNITVEMDEISIGPSVTRYALKPAEGVKLSRIVGLNNDLALALAAHPIRIEAPIPGKSLVGVEVPNTAKTTVGLATLLSSSDYQGSDKPLLMSLGKDITGKAHFSNLAKAPHALIAGATGSGKSVTIHAIITSLLYRNSPENLRFIMIDPKRVELTLYNKIPHLLTPVITDPKKSILALKWAGKEMSRRYDVLEKNGVRDIDSYHKTILAPALDAWKKSGADKQPEEGDEAVKLPETMPYIVVIIDELADIMQTYPRELESAIVRLAQMSRAVGIHLILSTQRPSVNVITGLIKANIPTRVALQVASQIDSRTILDQQGAEKLLGAGDMLYLGGEMAKPIRLQSAYISEAEVKKVVKHLVDEYKDEIMDEVNIMPTEVGASAAFDSMLNSDSLEEEDDLYESAREAVIAAGKASTSYLQRKLGVGYSRAAKLMDLLEQHSVIGPANGSKPREVLGSSADQTAMAEALPASSEEPV